MLSTALRAPQFQPGEYIMVRAEAGEGIYNDCTNVVLYKSSPSSAAKEKLGVYCWVNDACYIFNCTPEKAQTIPARAPDKVLGQSKENPCWETATAQSPMNRCADLDAREADADLNHVYQALLSKLKTDDKATKKLRLAQRLGWTSEMHTYRNFSRQKISSVNMAPSTRCATRKRLQQ